MSKGGVVVRVVCVWEDMAGWGEVLCVCSFGVFVVIFVSC